jgi:predicted esterase
MRKSTMQEHHITVPKTARYFTLGNIHKDLRQIWFVCHGYGQLASPFLERFEILNDGSRLIVAPEGLSRYYVDHAAGEIGASWMTREDRHAEINDYVRFLDRLHDHVMAKLDLASIQTYALGFSQGAAVISRWITGGHVEIDRVVFWGGPLPSDLDDSIKGDKFRQRVTLVLGERDWWINRPKAAELEVQLREREIAYRKITFDGGHTLDDQVLLSIT